MLKNELLQTKWTGLSLRVPWQNGPIRNWHTKSTHAHTQHDASKQLGILVYKITLHTAKMVSGVTSNFLIFICYNTYSLFSGSSKLIRSNFLRYRKTTKHLVRLHNCCMAVWRRPSCCMASFNMSVFGGRLLPFVIVTWFRISLLHPFMHFFSNSNQSGFG